MKESELLKRVQLLIPNSCRLFRNNTGVGWQGVKLQSEGNVVVLRDARPLRAGLCVGSSDLIGWKTIRITPDMVGKKIAVFTAIEVKTAKGKVKPEQQQFIDVVNECGGIADVVRHQTDIIKILQ